jgi:hypothetical protein
MVTIEAPSACWTLVRHAQAGLLSINTVQAPQSPASQPIFVPVRDSFSRTTLLSRSAGAPVTDTGRPFNENCNSS